MNEKNFQELTSLFFGMRQAIRANLPQGQADPNAWMRCEALRFIEESGEPTMREVAKHLRVTAPSATSLVRKLSSLGWIKREPSGPDRRVVRIALTAAGRRELARYRTQAERTMRKVFSKLPERDLSHLRRVLRSLRDIHTN
jgi:DNA-binding MarR family transcriptional regulator